MKLDKPARQTAKTHFFTPPEQLNIIYGIATAIYIVIFYGRIENSAMLLLNRLFFLCGAALLAFFAGKYPVEPLRFLRYISSFVFIIYWYPETYYLSNDIVVPNLDPFFDKFEHALFGCSPAMVFSKLLPQSMISEIMYFGYFSYYCLFTLLFTCAYFIKSHISGKLMFIVLCSFLIFYILFIFIPVSGPQFYYQHPDNQVPDGYFFCAVMRGLQNSGEQPTGAFPSSHIGMTLITIYLLFKHFRKLFYIALPAAIILFASTVYIKAHYLIDVVAAVIFTPFIYLASRKIYTLFNRNK